MWYKIDLVLKQAASGVLACAWLDTSMIFTGGYLGILGGAARGAMWDMVRPAQPGPISPGQKVTRLSITEDEVKM